MSDQRSSTLAQDGVKNSERLSPEVKEFMHMLQAIEAHPDGSSKQGGGSALRPMPA